MHTICSHIKDATNASENSRNVCQMFSNVLGKKQHTFRQKITLFPTNVRRDRDQRSMPKPWVTSAGGGWENDCHEDQSKGINLDERENKETSHHAQQPEGTDTGGFRACNRNGVLPRLRRGMCFAEPAVSSTGGYVSTE